MAGGQDDSEVLRCDSWHHLGLLFLYLQFQEKDMIYQFSRCLVVSAITVLSLVVLGVNSYASSLDCMIYTCTSTHAYEFPEGYENDDDWICENAPELCEEYEVPDCPGCIYKILPICPIQDSVYHYSSISINSPYLMVPLVSFLHLIKLEAYSNGDTPAIISPPQSKIPLQHIALMLVIL